MNCDVSFPQEKQALGGTVWEHEVMTYFSNQLGPADSWSAEFPSLNLVPTHELVDGQIVRFRYSDSVRKKVAGILNLT